jgi:L-rhamnose 1-dehydrogenase
MPPHSLLTGLTAAITGGTTGIGRAIALEFLRQGCNVAINHLNLPSDAHHVASLVSLAAEIKRDEPEAGRLIEVAGDVSKPETGKELVERAVREFGGLDVFVSNAGVCQFAEFLEYVSLIPYSTLLPMQPPPPPFLFFFFLILQGENRKRERGRNANLGMV